jgi:hypothetical protein
MLLSKTHHQTDLSGRLRRVTDPGVLLLPVCVYDRGGKEIGKFRSPRKFASALIAGAIVLVDGDRVTIGNTVVQAGRTRR